MGIKDEIMKLVADRSKRATSPDEIKHIHSLYTLEALIDIRDILDKVMLELCRGLRAISKQD